jgi:hypothetical protein
VYHVRDLLAKIFENSHVAEHVLHVYVLSNKEKGINTRYTIKILRTYVEDIPGADWTLFRTRRRLAYGAGKKMKRSRKEKKTDSSDLDDFFRGFMEKISPDLRHTMRVEGFERSK